MGFYLQKDLPTIKLAPNLDSNWKLIENEVYGRLFLVYSNFNPISDSANWMGTKKRHMMQDTFMMMG